MKKVLVAYYSRTGKTETMGEYIAEGVRLSGNVVEMKKNRRYQKVKKTSKGLMGISSAAQPIIRA